MPNLSSLKVKFILIFIALGLIPAIIISAISTFNSSKDVTDKVYNQLTAINQIKKQAIVSYFSERKGDMGVLIDIADSMQQQAFNNLSAINELKKSQLKDYFANNATQLEILASQETTHQAILELVDNFSKKLQWNQLLDKHDNTYKKLLSHYGWYDFF